MSEYNPKQKSLGGRGKVVLDLSNSATKADLKTAAGADTSPFAEKVDLANLKSNVDKLYPPNIRLSSSSSEYVFKTSSRRLGQDQYFCHTSSKHLQDVFKTSSRRLARTSSWRLQNVLKTSSKDVFKTVSRRINNLNCSCKQVLETHSTHFSDVPQWWLSTEGFAQVALLRNLWSVYNMCKSDKNLGLKYGGHSCSQSTN